MLVLSRKQNDTIVFPELGVTIHVIATAPGRVRLGIEAPRNIGVCRRELMDHPPRQPDRPVQSLSGEHMAGV